MPKSTKRKKQLERKRERRKQAVARPGGKSNYAKKKQYLARHGGWGWEHPEKPWKKTS